MAKKTMEEMEKQVESLKLEIKRQKEQRCLDQLEQVLRQHQCTLVAKGDKFEVKHSD